MYNLHPAVGKHYPFCGIEETVAHLFIQCGRLGRLFGVLKSWFEGLGVVFSYKVFISGPKYNSQEQRKLCLLNYLLESAKLAICKTRNNKILGTASVKYVLKGLVAA